MGGQLSLAQATLAGVGAFTAAQLANHLGLNILVGGIVGAVMAAVVATILALASLRLKGLGLALMTIAAALFFDNSVFDQSSISNGVSLTIQEKWVGLGLFNPNGHNVFILEMIVLVVCVIAVLLIRRGTIGQYLSAMRGSETAAAGIGINLTWQRVMIFAISGAMAGVGGTLLVVQQQTINNEAFSYEFGLAFVVIVVTTGVSTVEGAIQGGIGFVVIQQLLSYLPARLGGNSLVLVFFAFGALQYANHPEGILEFQKRKWTLRFEGLLFKPKEPDMPMSAGRISGAGGTNGPSPVGGVIVEALGAEPEDRHERHGPGRNRPSRVARGLGCQQILRRHRRGERHDLHRVRGARASASSAPTGPGRPPCSTASAVSSDPSKAPSTSTAKASPSCRCTSGPAAGSDAPISGSRSSRT